MKSVAFLILNKYRRLYNDRVRKALRAADIPFTHVSTERGHRVMVSAADESKAATIVLSIPFK